jgi:hypothetical protein
VSGIIYPFKIILNVDLTALPSVVVTSVTVENESILALNLKREKSPQYESLAKLIASMIGLICSI